VVVSVYADVVTDVLTSVLDPSQLPAGVLSAGLVYMRGGKVLFSFGSTRLGIGDGD
jgi:hypothetical protein